jgi:hypothetical protein
LHILLRRTQHLCLLTIFTLAPVHIIMLPFTSALVPNIMPFCTGSTRLYEDPDVDEYEGMDDVGYVRRLVPHQQEFIMRQLDLLQDSDVEGYFPTSSEQPYNPSDSALSRSSASSSASLSSPGMSSCPQNHASSSHDNLQQQDQQQQLGSTYQVRAGSGYGSSPTAAAAAATGDAAWDSGPAGIVFAEPVTTPTKDSRRSSNSEPKCSLSRVESLSNSFIDELESCEGAGDREVSGRLSEVYSTGGDASTPARRSGADGSSDSAAGGRSSTDAAAAAAGGYDDVIDLSPPSPPPDCAADAGIDLSNIFELGLRGSSRTSSVDVLYGSVRCWSETDSEFSNDNRPRSQGAGSTSVPGLLSGFGRPQPASKQQQEQQQQEQQQQEQQQESLPLEQQQEQGLQQQQQGEVQPQAEQQQEQQQQQEQPQAAAEPAEQQQQQQQQM